MPERRESVKLRDLIGSGGSEALIQLHRASSTVPVREIALVTDIEEVSAVGPDAIVILTQDVARGGWMISAALRYAWERRACALVVPQGSYTETAVELARRLDISLFTTDTDMKQMALELAGRLGSARAGTLVRRQALAERLFAIRCVADALGVVSRELGGVPVTLECSADIVGAETAAAPVGRQKNMLARAGGRESTVAVPLFPPPGEGPNHGAEVDEDHICATVEQHRVTETEQVLTTAAPLIRALVLDSQLSMLRTSLPLVSAVNLTGPGAVPAVGPPDGSELRRELPAHVRDLSADRTSVAVCIVSAHDVRIGPVLHQLWYAAFPHTPLARIEEGWLGFLPLGDESARATAVHRLRSGIEQSETLRRTGGLGVGISTLFTGSDHVVLAITQAWTAARLASGGPPAGGGVPTSGRVSVGESVPGAAVVDIADAPLRLLPRLLPRPLAEQLARTMAPRFVDDPAAADLGATVLAYLSHHGSARAASAALGVHRNTLQTRLRRAQELGVPLAQPELVVSLHMVFAAVYG